MPPRRREPAGMRTLLWNFFVFCIGYIVFYLIFYSRPVVQSDDVISASPTFSAQGDLMLGRCGGAISNGNAHDFDVLGSLTNIVDHPRRFLRTRYVNTARVLSQNVTAPVFGRAASGQMHNDTAELEMWLVRDTAGICFRAIDGIRYSIASLTLKQRRCNVIDLAGQRPLIEAFSEEAASGDVRCSPENIEERNEILGFFSDLEKNLGSDCDEAQHTILGNLGTLHRFRNALMSTAPGVVSELKSLLDTFASLLRADGDLNYQKLRYPGDLDPFTALVLHLMLGSGLVSSRGELLHAPPQYVADALKTGQVLPIRDVIRQELDRQGGTFNKISELFSSSILPGIREWLRRIEDTEETDAFEKNDNDNDESMKIKAWMRKSGWANADSADRIIRGINDGADHLEFLTGYLGRLQYGVPGMLARLDDWEADVNRLTAKLKVVISSGRKYIAQERRQPRSDGEGSETVLDITRWQVEPQNIESIWLGLRKLLRAFEDATARVEDFNPQDSWQDNWFETQMNRWSRERAALRAEWEESRRPKKPMKAVKKGLFGR